MLTLRLQLIHGLVEAIHAKHGSSNEDQACGHKKDVTEQEEPGQSRIRGQKPQVHPALEKVVVNKLGPLSNHQRVVESRRRASGRGSLCDDKKLVGRQSDGGGLETCWSYRCN